ncbi:hypothetical protein [uncultured Nostoc sp.]
MVLIPVSVAKISLVAVTMMLLRLALKPLLHIRLKTGDLIDY